MVGEDLTEERYERMSKDLTDREICRRYGISVSTLGRRKKRWKAEGRFYRLENFTPEQYHDLKALRHTDVEIAKMQGVGRTTLIKWKRENGVYSESVVERLLRTKTKADYYDMIAQGYDDSGIGKKWNASAKSVLRWRYKVGLYSNPRI